jgi:hypothetical protein
MAKQRDVRRSNNKSQEEVESDRLTSFIQKQVDKMVEFMANPPRPTLEQKVILDRDLQQKVAKISKIITDECRPILRPGVKPVKFLQAVMEKLMKPYDSYGKPAVIRSLESPSLLMTGFPNEEVINRIVAVFEKPITLTSQERAALCEDLRTAFIWVKTATQMESKSSTGKRCEHLSDIKNAALKLRALLDIDLEEWSKMDIDWISYHEPSMKYVEDEDPEARAGRLLAETAKAKQSPFFKYYELVGYLDFVIIDAVRMAKSNTEEPIVTFARKPEEVLIGGPLRTIYNAHLNGKEGADATMYSRFAVVVLKAMGFEYDSETVKRMVRDFKSGRDRRKGH